MPAPPTVASLLKALLLLSLSPFFLLAPISVSASPLRYPTTKNNNYISNNRLTLPLRIEARQQAAITTPASTTRVNTTIIAEDIVAAAAGAASPAASPAAVFDTAQACQAYSRTANLSAIGSNATIRSTFLDVSPVGKLYNSALLNEAITSLPALAENAQLNAACGNLSALAATEVASNFSRGVVGQFAFTGNHVAITNGPIVAVVTALCLVVILWPVTAL